MNICEFRSIERIRCRGRLAAVLRISLPECAEYEGHEEFALCFNEFYKRLAESIKSSVRLRINEINSQPAAFPAVITVSFREITEEYRNSNDKAAVKILKRHKNIAVISREIAVQAGGEIKKQSATDIFDIADGIILK